ncbi:TonB-dependent siderophore receptor [Myxacorys almedinensis A]|uniref:TonB-dependent siderophore receptor n=2 Tax=Myxacorys TaxID=2056239 RepID=A0A8J7YYU7_9CYAN|nr:TonB-dependent siderophore receptor [Myxacorys almedinensis A]
MSQVQQRLAILGIVWAIVGVALPGTAQEKQSAVPQPVESDALGTVRDRRPATTVQEWMAQVEAATVRVTSVRVEPTGGTVRVILETSAGITQAPTNRSEGNTLVSELNNAVLVLPEGNRVAIDKPGEGISAIEVIQATPTAVQIRITGETAVPVVEVVPSVGGLVLNAEADEDVAEEEVTVTGEGQGRYRVPNSSTATRTDTPLRDIPQSIQVIPQQVLEDRNVRTVIESVETVSGVVYNGGFADAPTGSVIIRGFQQQQQFRNGFRDTDRTGLTGLGTVEQIEVLKGPASVLFGAVEPGGIINVATKQPLSEPFRKFTFEVGNRSFIQPSLDFSGPLNTDKTVLYRLNASYQNLDGFQEFATSKLTTIAPSISFKIGDRTDLNLYYEYINSFANPPEGYAVLLSDGSKSPRSTYLGYPDFSFRDFTTQKFGYGLNHKLNDNWQIRNTFSGTVSNARDTTADPSALIGVGDRLLEMSASDSKFSTENYFGQIDAVGKFKTGSISHQLLFGFDANRTIETFSRETVSVPDLDIFNPNYNIQSPTFTERVVFPQPTTQRYGLYLQDQVALLDSLKLLIGGRLDWITTDVEGTPRQQDSAFSPRIGLVYQPSESVSLYTSYSQSFNPTSGFNPDGRAFKPSKGRQFEVGVKADFLDGRLSTTLAAYQITKSNITTPDPNDPQFSIQVGEQRSRGIELDVSGEILPGWKVIASYAHTDAKVTQDNSTPVGNRLTNVPKNQVSLWTTYEIQNGGLRGLGFGLGLSYVGDRPGDLSNSFTLGDYLRTDAALYYRRNRLNMAINVRNLFNTDYFRASDGGSLFLFRGEPLTITGSIGLEF